jgi:hypothetical protein
MKCMKNKNKKTNIISQKSVEIKTISEIRFFKSTKRTNHETFLFHSKEDFEERLISLCTIISSKISSEDHAKFMKSKSEYTKQQLRERVSKKYDEKIDVFVRKNANKLVEHCKKNHEITLKFESEISYVRNYRFMSKFELKIIKHYLNEHLVKKFIESNIFKTSTSVLITRKFENHFRICVNYQALNAVIEKNKYSISLINETLIKLFRTAMFIKLNVIHAFNRIRIKEEHEWLIAINTRNDQFEYLIMSFEFCNVSTFFQNYINSILQNYLDHFCIVYINDILIYNSNKKKHVKHVLKILRRLKKKIHN